MLGKRKMLGLAVTSRSVTAVEVVAADGGGRARCAAEFVFPDGADLREPAPLGKALRQFLRQEGFSASRCVIGMEAGWLTAREKTLPPGTGESVRDVLSLMAEREFASDFKELVFDYALGPDSESERSALLVAAPQRVLTQLTTMAGAAGLSVAGITVSTLALAACVDGAEAHDHLVLHLFGGGAELALHAQGALRMMRRLSVPVPLAPPGAEAPSNGWVADLADQVHRVASLLPATAGQPVAQEVLVWDDCPPLLDEARVRTLSHRIGLPVRRRECPEGLAPPEAGVRSSGAQFSAAAAVALHALQGRRPPVDLLHSRLFPRKSFRIGRKVVWAVFVAAVLIAAGVAWGVGWHRDRVEAAALETQLSAMADNLTEARATIDKVTFARPWYDRRPSYLDCMRELTRAFPQEGRIWTTSLAVQEDMRVVFSGKAVSESAVLDVLDRLKANANLADVKPLYLRQASRSGREVAFAMSFTFAPSNRTWPLPSAKKSSLRRR
jgi:hypothetical protein